MSDYIREGLNRRWLARRLGRQAITIHNALDIQRFRSVNSDRQACRAEFGVPASAYLIGSVGRLTRQKGYDVLLDAVKRVSMSIPELHTMLIGDGEDRDALQKQACELGVEGRVTFTGSRPDVDTLLSALDLFVCSSRWEGLSTAIMEAMAGGIPIIATDIPGNRELLQADQSAWSVPAEDTEALAQAIRGAYQNPDQAKEFAKQARRNIDAFGIDEVARRHELLYQLVIEQRTSRSWWNHRKLDASLNEALNKR